MSISTEQLLSEMDLAGSTLRDRIQNLGKKRR
jgi:hypothetical protein